MPRKDASSGRKQRPAPYLFIALAALLLVALLFFAMRALNAWNAYEKEAAITPTPSPSVRPVSVTADPSLVTFTPAPTATPSYLSSGSKGEMVSQLQTRLQALGFYTGAIDGQYGPGTKKAVEFFQRQHGLDADGIAGAKTLAMLSSDQAQPFAPTPTPAASDPLAGEQPLLVNQSHPLPDNYYPADLVTVKDLAGDTLLYADGGIQGAREAVEALVRMIQAAEKDEVSPWKLREGFRTEADQQKIFNQQVESYISEQQMSRAQAVSATRQTVADPGTSEHQTGLAFDLNVPGQFFGDTAQYLWLNQHCWDYGFIMRYTDEKQEITGILGEEWHVRYVGLEHSQKMRELDMCLEEYIAYLGGE